jgi:hypothetical protein
MLQAYFLILGGYLFNTIQIPRNIYKVLLVISTIYIILVSIQPFLTSKKYCSKPNQSNSLQWDGAIDFMKYLDAENFYFLVFYLFLFILSLQSFEWLIISVLGTIFLYLNKNKNVLTEYTRWCYFSAGIPVILLSYLLSYNVK